MKKEILQYEYKTVKAITNEELNNLDKLGKQGWHVSTNTTDTGTILMERPCGVITMDLPEFVVKKDISSYER